MRTLETLRRELQQMDGRGYPGYRALKGTWDLGPARLLVDHVQSDPFAPASRIRVEIDTTTTGLPPELVSTRDRRTAAADHLLRRFREALRRSSPGGRDKAAGSLRIMAPGQQVLPRTGVVIGERTVELRLDAALPASGRRIRGRAAAALLTEALPEAIASCLLADTLDRDGLRRHVELHVDQLALQEQLAERGLVGFVGEGAILPRASGDSDRPMAQGAEPFRAPESLAETFELPSGRTVTGMGIPEGVTVIVGGGYHGKSTLLRALERGIHPHIAGDGREWVLTRPDAVSLRAEDGRSVSGVDISPFIADLPQGTDTSSFSTADASGSTSQAAGLVEALEAGASALLIDEDTSATNFMIRDERMRALIPPDREPITPFVDRVRPLRDQLGISTILVAGGSSAFFEAADQVIALESYQPRDATAQAREIAAAHPMPLASDGKELFPDGTDRVLPAGALGDSGRKPARARGWDTIQRGHDDIDLSALSQLLEPAQTQAIALALEAAAPLLDGRRTVAQAVAEVLELVQQQGLEALSPFRGHPGDLALPRAAEIHAALNRCRSLPGASG